MVQYFNGPLRTDHFHRFMKAAMGMGLGAFHSLENNTSLPTVTTLHACESGIGLTIMEGKVIPFTIGLALGIVAVVAWPHITQANGTSVPKKEVGVVMQDAPGVQEEVTFENDRVRIVRFHFEPRAIVPMHQAPDVVATWLADGHFKLTHPDGTVQDMHVKAGQTQWFDAQMHSGENMADTPLDFVVVQMK
jgi:quercetin dioxygenase-like cupin family protein